MHSAHKTIVVEWVAVRNLVTYWAHGAATARLELAARIISTAVHGDTSATFKEQKNNQLIKSRQVLRQSAP
jgi:hypothetical protein